MCSTTESLNDHHGFVFVHACMLNILFLNTAFFLGSKKMESPKLLRIVRILFRKSLSATLLGLQHAMRAKKIMGYVAQTKLKRSKNTCSIIAMYV